MNLFKKLLIWLHGHDWEYKNPYRRHCAKCGRNEDMYGISDSSSGWWEEMYPLAHSPEKCESKCK